MKKFSSSTMLKVASASTVLGLALLSSTASAQAPQAAAEEDQGTAIIVTGSILRQTQKETASPVTTVLADDLDKRGLSTIQDGLQSLAANNGPALTNSFSANGAFAAGASAVSLRGLSTNSTLVLFDGLRAAYYPLADDGSRNFVDLNTIPDDIVERIEILRDGASASYGADAIAGVVNIITKKQVNGVFARAEGGISSRGDGGQYRLSLTAGKGDLDTDGYNAYISGFYYNSKMLKNSQRGYPYNSDDSRAICFEGTCGGNAVLNGLSSAGAFTLSTGANYLVRPYAATDTSFATPLGRWQNLEACGVGTQISLTATQQGTANPTTACQYDSTNLWGVINPDIERFGGSARFTARLNDGGMEAYTEFNFMQSKVAYTGFPATNYGTAPTGIVSPQFRTSGLGGTGTTFAAGSSFLSLPVYVCAARVACDTAADRKLNPNNPYAAAGQVARLIGRNISDVTYNETRTRSYRVAGGLTGQLTDKISLDVGATAMHTELRRYQDGYVYIQHLLDVIADGTFNFINPSATPQSVQDYLTPVNVTNATSDQYQIQATVGAEVIDLPGGPLQIGAGTSFRYEAVNAPSGNPDYNGPTQRYFTLNAFGTTGSRTIWSGFAELKAPILEQVTLSAAGRYDHYSSGQSAFSPKVGIEFRPIKSLLLRGTYSKGFRIPSFGEANALPTTGYVTNNASLFNNTYLAPYGCTTATFASCPAYIRSGSYGQTTLASPSLQPEKSRSFTGGVVFEPFRNVSFTVDYYNIRKTDAITTPSNAPAIAAYYTGQPIPAGYTVIADAPDPSFPTAKPRIAFVQAQLINADTITVEGLDFAANVEVRLTDSIKWRSNLEASLILKLEADLTRSGGGIERYDGTLGNFNLTAGSGTPKWHGNWQNSIETGPLAVTVTANYFGGYNLSAMDQGTGYKDCGLSSGYTACDVKAYITFDLNTQFKVNENFTIYMTMMNAFDRMPPIDPVTYGAQNYNPVQGGTGILGRYFKTGVKVTF